MIGEREQKIEGMGRVSNESIAREVRKKKRKKIKTEIEEGNTGEPHP